MIHFTFIKNEYINQSDPFRSLGVCLYYGICKRCLPSKPSEWQVRLRTLWTLSRYWWRRLNWSNVISWCLAESVGKWERGAALFWMNKELFTGRCGARSQILYGTIMGKVKGRGGKIRLKMYWQQFCLPLIFQRRKKMKNILQDLREIKIGKRTFTVSI